MKKTRILAIVICLLLMLQLTGCGSAKEPEPPQENTEPVVDEQVDQSDAPAVEEEEETAEDEIVWEVEEPEETYEPIVYFPIKPTIEETVLYDRDGIRIIAKELTYKYDNVYVSLLFENNTGKNLSFYTNTLACSANSINGHMFELGYMSETVPTGEQAEDSVYFAGNELSLYGISDIADLELAFRITDEDNNEILTGPCPIKTSLADSYDYSVVSFSDAMSDPRLQKKYGFEVVSVGNAGIYDTSDLKIEEELIFKNKDGETFIALEVENTGDEQKNILLSNVSVNGVSVYQGSWNRITVNPGKKGTLTITVDSLMDESFWKLAGLTEFGKIAFDLMPQDLDYNKLAEPSRVSLTLSKAEGYATGTEVYKSDRLAVSQLGIVPDDSEYSDDYHVLLIYENLTDEEITVRYPNDIVINGTEGSSSTYSTSLGAHEIAIIDINIYSHCFGDVGIAEWSEVTDLTLSIELRDSNYHTIEEATFTLDPAVTVLE